ADTAGSDWKFLRCDAYAYPGDPGCGAAIYDYNPITAGATGDNLYAVLYGEVTGNGQPATALVASSSRESSPEEKAAFGADQIAAERFRQQAPVPIVRNAQTGSAELTLSGWAAPLRAGERRQ